MRKTILVLSGKGGVGKTTVAVNLAYALSKKGCPTGVLDADIHGPDVLKLLGLQGARHEMKDGKIIPLSFSENLKVASMAGLINEDSALIWRGPLKHKAISQLASDVEWGKLDYFIVDLPPGTGDEHISAAQVIPDIAGAVIVSTPQQLSLMDALRAVDFCRKMNLKILGVIENMSGGVFGGGTVEKVCAREKIPFLGKIPISETAVRSAEEGRPFLDYDEKELNRSFEQIVKKLGGCEK